VFVGARIADWSVPVTLVWIRKRFEDYNEIKEQEVERVQIAKTGMRTFDFLFLQELQATMICCLFFLESAPVSEIEVELFEPEEIRDEGNCGRRPRSSVSIVSMLKYATAV